MNESMRTHKVIRVREFHHSNISPPTLARGSRLRSAISFDAILHDPRAPDTVTYAHIAPQDPYLDVFPNATSIEKRSVKILPINLTIKRQKQTSGTGKH